MTVRNRRSWGWSVPGPARLQSMLIGCRSRTELSREGELPCWRSTGHSLFRMAVAAAVELLAFWKRNAEQFTIVSLTAHRILCISVSWAQSEHDFCSVLLLRQCRAPVVAVNKRRWSSCDRAPRCAVTCWCSALWQWNSTMYTVFQKKFTLFVFTITKSDVAQF